jgi:hypothetical protein
MAATVGEDAHVKGSEGVRRAKQWLESTMRVSWVWVNSDNPVSKQRLVYSWPGDTKRTFSFDLGGVMRAGEFDGHQFSAEVKCYSKEHKQPEMYRRFLAQCYVALAERPYLCDHLMWITWAPFNSSVWHEHCTEGKVRQAVIEHRHLVLGTESADEATTLIDDERVKAVADRLWLIVITEKQERLLPLLEWQAVIEAVIRKGQGA